MAPTSDDWRRATLGAIARANDADTAPDYSRLQEELSQEGFEHPTRLEMLLGSLAGEELITYAEATSMAGFNAINFRVTEAGRRELERLQETLAVEREGVAYLTAAEIAALEPLISEIRGFAESGSLPLDREDVADLVVQIDTVQVQARSPKPRRNIVRSALEAIGEHLRQVPADVRAGVVGAAAVKALEQALQIVT